jgi:small subunit ribosomal protein S8
MPDSRLRENVLAVLKEEGYIADFRKEPLDNNRSDLIVDLKYVNGDGAIQEISVVSKPGRRVYSGSQKMPKVLNGLGVAIVSTPNGVMTDQKARLQNVGGEVLCRIV